jgi:hypothetical protein
MLCKILNSFGWIFSSKSSTQRLWRLGFWRVAPGRSRTVRLVGADRPGIWRGQSAPLAQTVRTLAEQCSSIPFYCGDWYQLFIYRCLSHYCSGFGGLRKKLAGRFKSKRPRGDDADYTPTTDSEAQSSAGGTESMDAKDFPHVHPDYPIDTIGWTYPKRRFSMAEYCSRRTMNQYTLPSDTNIQFFHTQLQFDVFWGTLVDTNFHKHQAID